MAAGRRPFKQMLKLLDALTAQPHEWRHGYEIMKVGLAIELLAIWLLYRWQTHLFAEAPLGTSPV